MAYNEDREVRRNQVGLALDLITNKFAFADFQDNQFWLLGFTEDQRRNHQIGYDNVMARARDVVLKAIMGETLPEVYTPEEQQEDKEVLPVPQEPQPDPVGVSNLYTQNREEGKEPPTAIEAVAEDKPVDPVSGTVNKARNKSQ